MKLQELINETPLNMTEEQVKAFFLGALCADRPLPFLKALDELLEETPESKKELEAELKKLWEQLARNTKSELSQMFPEDKNTSVFLETARDQLDFFLTALSLSGTNTESCVDDELAELIEELENIVEDLDEFLSNSEACSADGDEFKEFLIETWKNFISYKK